MDPKHLNELVELEDNGANKENYFFILTSPRSDNSFGLVNSLLRPVKTKCHLSVTCPDCASRDVGKEFFVLVRY